MTPDVLATRLSRLESRMQATDALVHCLLPAIDPARRQVVMQQFQQYCRAMEARVDREPNAPELEQHLQALAEAYARLEGALQQIQRHEAKKRAGG